VSDRVRISELRELQPWNIANVQIERPVIVSKGLLLALVEAVEAARDVPGLRCGAFPRLADALARFDFGESK
jgi:hypothetical protein